MERYAAEAVRLLRVLDHRIREAEFLADEYSIADVATYLCVRAAERMELEPPSARRCRRLLAVGARPAVARGMAAPERRRVTTSRLAGLR